MAEGTKTPPQPTGSMQQFAALIGEWATEGTHPQLPSPIFGHSSFEWLREDSLLVWHFKWESADVPNAFSVIGRDDGSGETCTMLYCDERGVSRIYQMSLEEGVWKMWRDSAGFSQRTTGTFSPDRNTITCKGELSRNGTNWEQDLDVIYRRK